MVKNSCPEFNVTASLMLADKNALTTVDGLNQLFLLVKDKNGRAKAIPSKDITQQDLGAQILTLVNVDNEIHVLHNTPLYHEKSFSDHIKYLSENYKNDQMIFPNRTTLQKLRI